MPPYIDVIANLFSAQVMRKKDDTKKTGAGSNAKPTAPGKTSGAKNMASTMRSTVSGRTTPYKR